MRIIFTVTNDLTYDQRMQRICTTLATRGYEVCLVGRKLPTSKPLIDRQFQQKRLQCWFPKGFLFYAEYNLRLFFFLLTASFDAVCSIDLDTLPAGCWASLLRNKKRVFDAHEYFTEVPEVVHRPFVRGFWQGVAAMCLPFYRHAYTVGPRLAAIFQEKYGLPFAIIRNVPFSRAAGQTFKKSAPAMLLYQGALNEGRGIESLLLAMQHLDNVQLIIAGEGDLSADLRQKAKALNLNDKVQFLGYVEPEALWQLTQQAWLGLNLLENRGLSYYYSLANKFFDYIQAEVPVLTMQFPEYEALNQTHEVAILLQDLEVAPIVAAIQKLQNDASFYEKLCQNCAIARQVWNWEQEQQILLQVWKEVGTP
jgi:glycosyltransferase involved in cell wall biosynthesis